MELNHLKYFFEVAKSASFTDASRRLHISQSALSKAVRLLEEAEKVKLFERSKQGVTLTNIGLEVFRHCEVLFQLESEIANVCRGSKEVCEGPVNLGASDHITNYLLIKTVQKVCAEFPKVIPVISSGAPNDIIAALLNNEIEFGLFFTQIPIPQIMYESISETEMVVVCHRKYASEIRAKMTPSLIVNLIQKTGFVSSIRSQYQHDPSAGLLKFIGPNPRIIFQSNSQEAQKRFCMEVDGAAFLAKFMVEDEIEAGLLVEVPMKPIRLQIHLARRKGRTLSAEAMSILKYLK